jgi:hypothetical protein
VTPTCVAMQPTLASARHLWGPLSSRVSPSGNSDRLWWEGQRQQVTNRPPPTRQAGRQRLCPLALALGLALASARDWLCQREE